MTLDLIIQEVISSINISVIEKIKMYRQRRKQMEKRLKPDFYKNLRSNIQNTIGPNQIVLIPAASHVLRNGDNHFPFRQQSDYAYLTGLDEADGCLVLTKHTDDIYVLPADPLREQWDGYRLGAQQAKEITGCDGAYTIEKLAENLESLMLKDSTLLTTEPSNNIPRLHALLPSEFEYEDCTDIVADLRVVKQPEEIALMQHSCDIAASAHKMAMQAVKPGIYEYELEAVFLSIFRHKGAEGPAYPSIVGSGNNSCILHYNENNKQCADGDLVLIDAGCEYGGYASDITRTFPASGVFSTEQRVIYQIVLDTQLQVIDAIKPGVTTAQLQDISTEYITAGLIECGLLSGNLHELLDKKAYFPFYMHRVGHWLGRDVHDVGRRGEKEGTALVPGMVVTVEPGIYIMNGLENVDEKWWEIGVRIEDDVLVTETGSLVLSRNVPKAINEVEALCTS